MITNAELWALAELSSSVKAAQQGLEMKMCAKDACVKLLEVKYNARYNSQTGEFLPKDGAKEEKDVKKAVKEA